MLVCVWMGFQVTVDPGGGALWTWAEMGVGGLKEFKKNHTNI